MTDAQAEPAACDPDAQPLAEEHLRVQGRTIWHKAVAEMQTALDA